MIANVYIVGKSRRSRIDRNTRTDANRWLSSYFYSQPCGWIIRSWKTATLRRSIHFVLSLSSLVEGAFYPLELFIWLRYRKGGCNLSPHKGRRNCVYLRCRLLILTFYRRLYGKIFSKTFAIYDTTICFIQRWVSTYFVYEKNYLTYIKFEFTYLLFR